MSRNIADQQTRRLARRVLQILEKEDGRSFARKKAEAVKILEESIRRIENQKKQQMTDCPPPKNGAAFFWRQGDLLYADPRILLRRIGECDRGGFLAVRREYTVMPFLLRERAYTDMIWNDQRSAAALMCSVLEQRTKAYIGYCGIKNTAEEMWEITIELLKAYTGQGIGYLAVSKLLDAIALRCGVTRFRVRIDSDNYASQGLFEKLGAAPNGVSRLMVYDEQAVRACEEENLQCMDKRLLAVAKKFGVTPRTLLSHVLEYRLDWQAPRHRLPCID